MKRVLKLGRIAIDVLNDRFGKSGLFTRVDIDNELGLDPNRPRRPAPPVLVQNQTILKKK